MRIVEEHGPEGPYCDPLSSGTALKAEPELRGQEPLFSLRFRSAKLFDYKVPRPTPLCRLTTFHVYRISQSGTDEFFLSLIYSNLHAEPIPDHSKHDNLFHEFPRVVTCGGPFKGISHTLLITEKAQDKKRS